MRTSRQTGFGLHGNRGAAYILALVTVLVGTVLALAMLQAGNSYFRAENSRTKKQAAINIAQSGVDYAYWEVHYQGQPLPYTTDVSSSSGSFHVVATDDGSRDPSTMLITSTGTCGGDSYTIKRVTLGLLPYHYAWCENHRINIANTITSTSLGRGMRTNDDIFLSSGWNSINTGLWSTGSIAAWGSASPRYPSSPPIAFPDINYGYYSSVASNVYNFDATFTSLSYPSDGVVYVNGNSTINLTTGKYRGAVTVVATGNITVRSSLAAYDSNSYLALITNKTITIQTTALSVDGAFYAHKSDGTGRIVVQGTTAIVGTVSSDDITTDHSVDIHRDSALNLDIMRRLRLPGL